MAEQILERGDHGEEWKKDFVLYIISMCIIGHMNSDWLFRILKSSLDVSQIPNYSWCVYLLQCLNEILLEWKQDCTRFFRGPTLFLMASKLLTTHFSFHLYKLFTNPIFVHLPIPYHWLPLYYLFTDIYVGHVDIYKLTCNTTMSYNFFIYI